MKLKKCKICKGEFRPERQMQSVCSFECSIEYGKKHFNKSIKEEKQKVNKALRQLNDSDINIQKRLAQKVFNTYIRMRDDDLPCISCNYSGNNRQWHAGHYRPRGSHSALAFNEDNVHKQCSICNNHLSGNLVRYKENLINKIGLERVEFLENYNIVKKPNIEEYKEIIVKYRKKIKDLKL